MMWSSQVYNNTSHPYFGIEESGMGPDFRIPSIPAVIPSSNNSIFSDSSEAEMCYDNSSLKFELLRKNETEEFQKIFETRQQLAVIQQCQDILKALRTYQVVLLVGSKGCGKTTQITQMLLDDYIFNNCGTECCIACAQTRKQSAITAAKRVAYERLEALGNSVGYWAGGRKIMPRKFGSILYCTAYYIIGVAKIDPLLKRFTAIVLDDIQDNSVEFNQLMGHLKNVLKRRNDLKIILMTNTASEDTFCKYFKEYHAIYIRERSCPIIKRTASVLTLNESLYEAERASIIPVSSDESSTSDGNGNRLRRTTTTINQIPASFIKRRRLSSISNRPDHQVAIIDRSETHGRISDDRWLELEKKLLAEMVSNKWSNEGISFDGANWSRGVKLVHCSNNKSLDFLKATIASVGEFWPGAQLEVIPRSDLPLRVLAKMWIPPPVPNTKAILTLIQKQNNGLETKNWKIIRQFSCKTNSGKYYHLFIDGKSLNKIRECGGRIKFGLNFIRIHIEEKVKK